MAKAEFNNEIKTQRGMKSKMARSLNKYVGKELIGKMVFDSYDKPIGKIIGFSPDSHEPISFFGIELNNGKFMKCECSKVYFDQDKVIINNSWKTQAEYLISDISYISKKISAINELKKNGEIPKKVYDKLKNKFENEKKILIERRRYLSDRLKERRELITSQFKEIYEFLTHVKISHYIGDVDGDMYQGSHIAFKLMINRLLSEEGEIKFALNGLANNLSTLPPEPVKSLPPSKPSQIPITLQISEANL